MKIGIVGTGHMGSGLGKLWAAKGHEVFWGSRDPEKAKRLARSVPANADGGTVAQAFAFGDVVLLATPWSAATYALKSAGPLAEKIIIDCTNPLKPDTIFELEIGHTTSAAEEIAKSVPRARVVKAFNTIFAEVIHSSPLFGSQKANVFYCGDEKQAKDTVARLIRDIGFEPVDAGPLKNARYLEPLAELVIQLGRGSVGMGPDFAINVVRR